MAKRRTATKSKRTAAAKTKPTATTAAAAATGNPRQFDMPTLESWLWHAACAIRGAMGAPKYKDYTLPLCEADTHSPLIDPAMDARGWASLIGRGPRR